MTSRRDLFDNDISLKLNFTSTLLCRVTLQAFEKAGGFAPLRELARYRLRRARYPASAAWTGFSENAADRFGLIELLAQLAIAHRHLAWLAAPDRGEQASNVKLKVALRHETGLASKQPCANSECERGHGQVLSELQPSDIAAVEMLSRRIACEAATLMRHLAIRAKGGSNDSSWLRLVNCEARFHSMNRNLAVS